MNTALAIGFLFTVIFLFVQFNRQEEVQDEFEAAVSDVEGRLEWARTRSQFPFGMKAQLEVSDMLLDKAKKLWNENKWQQAYRIARQSQDAMNKAQRIYSSAL